MAWLPGACNTPFLRSNKCVVPGLGRGRLPSEVKGHTFESCRVRQFAKIRSTRPQTPFLRFSSAHGKVFDADRLRSNMDARGIVERGRECRHGNFDEIDPSLAGMLHLAMLN